LHHQINNDLASTYEGNKITFKEWYERYYKLMSSGWPVGNKKQYENMYNWYLHEFNKLTLSEITLIRYQAFINSKIDILAYQTVKEIHSQMMAIINSAVNPPKLH